MFDETNNDTKLDTTNYSIGDLDGSLGVVEDTSKGVLETEVKQDENTKLENNTVKKMILI